MCLLCLFLELFASAETAGEERAGGEGQGPAERGAGGGKWRLEPSPARGTRDAAVGELPQPPQHTAGRPRGQVVGEP